MGLQKKEKIPWTLFSVREDGGAELMMRASPVGARAVASEVMREEAFVAAPSGMAIFHRREFPGKSQPA